MKHTLETRNITMRFGQEEIIRDVSIYVDQGELIDRKSVV